MGSGFVLVDRKTLVELWKPDSGIDFISLVVFGEGLWLLHIRSGRIPLGWPKMLEIVTWDTEGPVSTRFKPWTDV